MSNVLYRSRQPLVGTVRKSCRTIDRKRFLTPYLCVLGLLVVFSGLSLAAQDSVHPFMGRWDLTLTGPSTLPSWIDVSKDQGQLKVLFVGVTDHATPMKAEIQNGQLSFVSPANEEGFGVDTTYSMKRVGDRLVGTVTNSEHKWSLEGKRAPALAGTTVSTWGKPITLFDGKDFAGWRFKDPAHAVT